MTFIYTTVETRKILPNATFTSTTLDSSGMASAATGTDPSKVVLIYWSTYRLSEILSTWVCPCARRKQRPN